MSVLAFFSVIAAVVGITGQCPWYLALIIAVAIRGGIEIVAVLVKLAVVKDVYDLLSAEQTLFIVKDDPE